MYDNLSCSHFRAINHHGRIRTVATNGFGIASENQSWVQGNINNGIGRISNILYVIKLSH